MNGPRAYTDSRVLSDLMITLTMGQSKADAKQRLDLQYDYEEKRLAQYKAAIGTKYKLTKDQMTKIVIEGMKRNWPEAPRGQ
jgi:hypothetical protein